VGILPEGSDFSTVDFLIYEMLGFSCADDFSGQDIFPFFTSFEQLDFFFFL